MTCQAHPTPLTAPLPKGWRWFLSYGSPERGGSLPRFYATAPYVVPSLPPGPARNRLDQTLSASTWAELHRLVTEQEKQRRTLMS
ncbi:hypothetical protein [Streptomyces hygroscopicus]|uniref:hypothetical protein n=1 Tax=Streptomyces hygroscopicus TaxID=1912 RepID=UPI0008257EF2